jgi:hypothetical protein
MTHRLKQTRSIVANLRQRWRGRGSLGEVSFQSGETLLQNVIIRVTDFRRRFAVVQLIVTRDLAPEFRDAFTCVARQDVRSTDGELETEQEQEGNELHELKAEQPPPGEN